MISFLGCHKELHRFSPSRNPAEEAPLAGLKEEGRLLPRPWITRTKPSRLGLAQGGGLVRRGWLSVFSTLAIGFVCLAAPLRAQFAYAASPRVALEFHRGHISAYHRRCQRVSDAGPRFALRGGERARLSSGGSDGQVRLRGKQV